MIFIPNNINANIIEDKNSELKEEEIFTFRNKLNESLHPQINLKQSLKYIKPKIVNIRNNNMKIIKNNKETELIKIDEID